MRNVYLEGLHIYLEGLCEVFGKGNMVTSAVWPSTRLQNLYKNSEEVWDRRQENIPQGLKPLVISAFFGTTEVVPFQNSLAKAVLIHVFRTGL